MTHLSVLELWRECLTWTVCAPCRVGVCEQEEITLTRALDPLKKGVVPSYRLIKKLEAAPIF